MRRGLRSGDIVTANPYFNCGTCYSCRRGLERNCCVDNQTMGVQRAAVLIRALSRCRSSGSIRWGKAGAASSTGISVEPFAIGYHGVQQQAMIQPDDRVLVVEAPERSAFLPCWAAKQKGARVYITEYVAEVKLRIAA